MTLLLSCDLSKGDFSLLPAVIQATVLEMNAVIFSIFTVISGVASVFCIPKDFLFKFLFLEVGGMKPQPRRLGSLECRQAHSVMFSSPGPRGDAEIPGLVPAQAAHVRQRRRFLSG